MTSSYAKRLTCEEHLESMLTNVILSELYPDLSLAVEDAELYLLLVYGFDLDAFVSSPSSSENFATAAAALHDGTSLRSDAVALPESLLVRLLVVSPKREAIADTPFF